jgi:hypothetical protein
MARYELGIGWHGRLDAARSMGRVVIGVGDADQRRTGAIAR